MFHVDSSGVLKPCFMVPEAGHDLVENNFYDAWYKNGFIDFRKPGKMPQLCIACDKKALCGYCPGFFKLETGNEQIPATFLCEIGEQRKQMILKSKSEEKINDN